MKVLGYVNMFNRGVNRVQTLLEENENGKAEFIVDRITVFGVMIKDASINDEVVTENDTKHVTKNVTKNVTEHLTDRQLKIIELIRKDATISTGTIAEQCNVTKMTIKRDIDKMSHIVVHIGPKNGGKWIIIDND